MEYKKYLIDKSLSVRTSMEMLNTAKRVLFVIDEEKLIGSITDGDIRRWILSGGGLDEQVMVAMNPEPKKLYQNNTREAKKIIEELDIFGIPIVDEHDHVIDVIFWNESHETIKAKEIDAPVVIMAGGKGERLLPYTSIVPKPLIPIGEKSISELVIDSFKKNGCKRFYFSLNYRKNMIKAYYDDLEKDYSVEYIEEEVPLGTGGSLYYVKDKMQSDFFVSNCDILLDVDYSDVLKFHLENNYLITIITSLKKYTIPYGTIGINNLGHIQLLEEKPSIDYLVNTGVYLVSPAALDYLEAKTFIHLPDLIEKCLNDGKLVGAYPIGESAWMDMGQFEDMENMKEKVMRR